MTTAFVLSGGANLGAVQVGMLQALDAEGIRPDLVIGTSVGALNGAWVAAGRPIDDLADLWRSLRTRDIFPVRPLLGLRGFLGRTTALVPSSGLRQLLNRHIPFARLENVPLPFSVIATEVCTGREVQIDRGPTVPAILASSAIPVVFRPVEIDGRMLIDGGIVDNTPISKAIAFGATDVWVLSTSCRSR